MRALRIGVVLVVLSLTACGGGSSTKSQGTALCKSMVAELATLATVSTNVHAQQYPTPKDAVNAIAPVLHDISVTTASATSEHVNDLAVAFGAMLIAVQDYETNVATQDASKEAGVVTELQQGDATVRTACAKY
jgi:hypothetical protein